MTPPPDATAGKRLTFEQTIAHIGGEEHFISAEGQDLIERNSHEYIWKYPGHGYCTACGADVGDMKARHGWGVTCPACGRGVEFRHEARGHRREFWQFCLYEWRRSAIDPEAVVLTATHVWRDSMRDCPERTPKCAVPIALYIFRPGEAVTVYKTRYRWMGHGWSEREWNRMDEVTPAHTAYQSGGMRVVMDYGGFEAALEGTRIGRLYHLLRNGRGYGLVETMIDAVASCARRPWLEYLAKAGQASLASQLMTCRRIPRTVIANQRARNPRALLGLTEAQWHEARRDGIALSMEDLERLHYLRRMGLGNGHLAEALQTASEYTLRYIAPMTPAERRERRYETKHIGDYLANTPEKLRRRAFRKIIEDAGHMHDWEDYYRALEQLGEDFTNAALVTPRDFPEMHDRMIRRLGQMKRATEARRQREKEAAFREALEKLRGKYVFRAAGLELRPFETCAEIIREGKALDICIGNYVDRYFEGKTVICCLRRAEEPDQPFRAVEFSAGDGRRCQDRGYKNDRMGVEPGLKKRLKIFWAAFDSARERRKSA